MKQIKTELADLTAIAERRRKRCTRIPAIKMSSPLELELHKDIKDEIFAKGYYMQDFIKIRIRHL